MPLRLILVYFVLAFTSLSLNAQESTDYKSYIYPNEGFVSNSLEGHIKIINQNGLDPKRLDSIQLFDLKELSEKELFELYGDEKMWIWGYFSIKNNSSTFGNDYIRISAFSDSLELYEWTNDSLEFIIASSGFDISGAKRTNSNYFYSSYPIIPVNIEPFTLHHYFFKIQVEQRFADNINEAFEILNGKQFTNSRLRKVGFQFLFEGLILLIALLCLFLIFSFKEIIFMYYSLLLILFAAIIAINND